MNIREFRDYIKSTKQDDFYTLDYCGLKFRLFKDDKVIISYGGKATRYDLIFFLRNPLKWYNLFITKYQVDIKEHNYALLIIEVADIIIEYSEENDTGVDFSMKVI